MEISLFEDEKLILSENDVKIYADLPAALGSKWRADMVLTDKRFIVLNRHRYAGGPALASAILVGGNLNRMEFALEEIEFFGGREKKGFFFDKQIFTIHTRMKTALRMEVSLNFEVANFTRWQEAFSEAKGMKKKDKEPEKPKRCLVRCAYCNSLMENDSLKCPGCGARRTE